MGETIKHLNLQIKATENKLSYLKDQLDKLKDLKGLSRSKLKYETKFFKYQSYPHDPWMYFYCHTVLKHNRCLADYFSLLPGGKISDYGKKAEIDLSLFEIEITEKEYNRAVMSLHDRLPKEI